MDTTYGANLLHFSIRPATTDDACAIAGVHQASRQQAYRSILSDRLLNAQTLAEREKYWKEQTALAFSSDVEIYVAEHEAESPEIVGFIVLLKHNCFDDLNSLGLDTDCKDQAMGEIDRIYVHPGLIGNGVGRALMSHALQRLKTLGCTKAFLWVFEANPRARRFYQSMGFSSAGCKRQIMPYPHDLLYLRNL